MYLAPLLLAVTTVVQDSAPPAPRVRASHRSRAVAVAPPVQAATLLAASQADLEVLAAHATALTVNAAQLEALAVQAPVMVAPLLDVGLTAAVLCDEDEIVTHQQDPADSLYRAARQALNRNQYTRAAELFRQVRQRYRRSAYVPDTYYWEAFALYRTGSAESLKAARTALKDQANRYPDASTHGDAEALMMNIQSALARLGDEDAARALADAVEDLEPPAPPVAVTPPTPGTPPAATAPPVAARPGREPRPPRPPRPSHPGRSSGCDDEDDVRMAAIQGLMNMDAERAMPILKSVLARRDEGSTCLRRQAIFLVSQKRSTETASILLHAARSDPDREVRGNAVFWLSQVPGEETAIALDSILRDEKDPEIQEKALFALSQHRSARAAATLRTYAGRRDAPRNLREQAIFWIGQQRRAENAQFLKDLYKGVEDDELKDKIIFALSQMGGPENHRWMMDIALDQNENIERRKNALFWASQGKGADIADLVRLYDSMQDREMKEKLIFVYSQRRDAAALDKLFAIAKNDPDRELRKNAIFWIGQSRDPRAAQFLQELINQ
ncbi:MAG TPA: HEAT repeat domain-containing protein [Gemmatimonadales bacterium]|jgi:HEAT repeat protein|nr:HEAT repeat domain-containing protein [Gemmatimonadales bacterium]